MGACPALWAGAARDPQGGTEHPRNTQEGRGAPPAPTWLFVPLVPGTWEQKALRYEAFR